MRARQAYRAIVFLLYWSSIGSIISFRTPAGRLKSEHGCLCALCLSLKRPAPASRRCKVSRRPLVLVEQVLVRLSALRVALLGRHASNLEPTLIVAYTPQLLAARPKSDYDIAKLIFYRYQVLTSSDSGSVHDAALARR
jgi:hypothetical protein